ncbi:hypothetical protein [Pusillimonas sp.]|uniref:hypothetical protein n=1 Tax=Pusillimonas sp. TaxID=3040095 RepID=UPI0029B1841A|nr:hypothetical protein [Pusillimonas sp.]MDX3895177.1 hypothetical protein [Pusillimonas sp.]
MSTPDPNAKAPRPSGKAEASSKPSMDSPPRRQSAERASFDRGTAAASQDAAVGQRPGNRDHAATQAEGTADTPSVERSKHMPPASP